jgi:CubicO group peptidase (beta-lactamase class C family)
MYHVGLVLNTLRSLQCVAVVCLAGVLSNGAVSYAAEYYPPPDEKGGWRTLSDPAKIREVTGLDVGKLDQAFDYAQQTSQHGGLLVVRHGYLVYERYFGRGAREALPELASCGKAFTSVAVGMVLKDKAKDIPNGLDEKVYNPKYLPNEYFPVDDPRKSDITLGQLLSMSAGVRGTNPVYVKGVRQTWENPTIDNGPWSTTDDFAMRQSLWCAPGDCYSYSTASSHLPAMIVRRLAGMEMEEYMRRKLTTPLGFGTWGYAMYRPKLKSGIDSDGRMLHTPGGGSIAVRSTDVLRFAYLMLREGKWRNQQIVPAEFVRMCGRTVKYNPHYSHSFNFNVNDHGAVAGVPADAYWKGGAGGYAIYVVPSLDMVIYKMGGSESQYDPALTRLPVKYTYDGSRKDWKAPDPKLIGDATTKTLQMIVSAVTR